VVVAAKDVSAATASGTAVGEELQGVMEEVVEVAEAAEVVEVVVLGVAAVVAPAEAVVQTLVEVVAWT